MQGVDEQENVPKNPRSRKRSSILKMPPIPRSPLKDRNKEEKSRRSSRRVSFADKHQIKEFHAESSTLTVQNNEERIVINSLDLRLSNIINDGLKLCENQLNEDSEATQGLDISLSKSESDVFESLSAEEPSIHVSVRRGSKKRKSTYEETEHAKAMKLNDPESTIIQEMTLTEDRMDLTLAYAGLIEKSSTSHCDVTICKTLDMNLTALSPQNDCDAIESYQSNKNNIYEYLSKETDISEYNRTLLLEESLNLTCTDPQSSSADENSEESSEERNTKTDGAFENPVEASCIEQATKVEGEENSSTEKLASRYQQDSKNEELCPTNQLLIKSTSNETLKIDKCKTSNENVGLNSSQKKLICQMDMKENVVFKKTVIDDLNAFELDSNNKMASYQSYKNSTRDLEKTHIFNNDENALEETQYLNTSIQLLNENFECKLKVDLAKSEIGEQKHDNRKQSLYSKKCLPQNKADINDILMTTKDNYGSCFPKGDTIIFPNSLSSDMEETCYSSNVTKNVVAEEKENLPFKNKFCSQKQDKTIVFENSLSDYMEETCYSSSATRNVVIEEKENLPFKNKFSQKKDKTIVFENSLSDYMEETCYSSSATRNVVIEEKENLPFKNKFSQKKDKTIVFENSLSDDMEETCHFSNATRNIVIEEKENLPIKNKFCSQKKDKTIVFENSLSDDMEETCHFSNAARNIVIEEKENLPLKSKFCFQKKDKTIVFENSLSDDMEETCHFSNATRNIVIEEKENLPIKNKFCSQKKDKTIVFENSLSDDMEETCHFSNATRNIVIEEKENLPIKSKFCFQKKDKTIVFENSLCDDMEETFYSSNATRNVMVEKKENFPIKNKFCFQEGDKTIVFENSLSDDMEETCYSSTLTKRNNVAAEEKENFPIKNDLLEASLINTKKLNCFQKGDKTVVFQNTFSEIMEETCHPATTINDTEVSEKENPHDKFTKVSEMNTEGFIASLQRASKTIIFGQSFSDDMEETCHPINVTTNILANKSQKLQNKSAFGDISFLQREKKESCSKERNKTIIFENTVSNDMEETCYPITLSSNPDYNVKKDQCYPHNFDDISLIKKNHNTHTLKENKTIFFEKSFADVMEETCFTSGNRTTSETDDQSIANHSTFKSSILNKNKGQGASTVLSNIFNLSKTNSEFVYSKPNSGIKSTQNEIRNSKTVSEAQPYQSDITVPSVQESSYSNKSRSILENDRNSFLLKSKNFDSVLNKNKGESASQVLSNIFSLSKTKSEFSYSKSDRDAKSTASQPEIQSGSERKTCHSDDVDKIIDQNISSGALNKSMPLSLDNRQLLPKIIVTSDNFINTKEEKSEIMSSRKKSETPKIEVQHNRTSDNFPNNSDFVNKTLSTSQQNCNPDAQLIMSVNSQLSKTERETQKLHSEDKSKYYANEDERDLKMPDEENRFGSSGGQLLLQSNFTNKDKIKLDSSQQNILHQTNSHNESSMMNIIKKDLSGLEDQLSFNRIDPFVQNNVKVNDKCFENEVLGIKVADVHEEDSRSNKVKSDIEQTSAEQKSSKSLVNEDITKNRSNNVSNTESLDVMDQKEEDCIQNEQCISFNTNIQLPEKDPRSERVEEHNSDNTCIEEDQPNLGNQQYDIPFNKHEGVISSHSSMNHSSVSKEMMLQNLQHDNVSPQKPTKEFSSSKEVNYKVSEDEETSFNLNISCKQMKKSDIQIDEFEVEMQELSTINNESKHQMSKPNIAEHDVSSSNLKQCNKSDNISVVEDTMQKTSEVQTEDYKTDLGECVDCFETVSLESVTGQNKSSLSISTSNALQMMEQPCSLSKSSLSISTSNALQMMEQPCSLSKSSLSISTSNALQMMEQPCSLSHKSSLPLKDISSIDTVTSNQSCRNKLKLENNKEDPVSTIPDNSMMNGLSCTFAEKQLFNTSGLPKQEGTSDEDVNLKTCVTDTSNSIQLKGFDSDAKCLDVSSLKITSNIHEGKDFSDNSVQKSQSLLKRSNDIDDKMVCLKKQNFQGTDFGNEAKRCKLDKTNQVDDDHENLNEVSKLNFDVPITSEGDGREFLITNAYKISTASEEKELCISEDVNLSSHNTLKTNIKHNEDNRDFADQKTLSDEIESKSSNFQNEEQSEVNNHCLDLVEVKTPNKNIDSKEHTNSFANISLSQNINRPSGDDNLKNEANHAKSKELDKSHNEILNIEGGCKLDTSHKSECRANNTDLSFKHVHNPENSIKIEEESLVQFKRMEESESLKMKSTSSYRSEIEKVDKIRHSIKKSTKPFAAAGEKNNFPLELTLKHDVQTPFAKKENLVSQKTPKVSSVDGTPSCTVKIGMNNLSSKKSQCTGKIHDVNSNNSSNAYSKTGSSQMNELIDDIELITDVQFPDITSELYLSNCSKTNVLEPSPLISPSKCNQSHLKINTDRNYIDHHFETSKSQPTNVTNIIQSTISRASISNVDLKSLNSAHILNSTRDNSYESLMGTNSKISERSDTSKLNVTLSSKTQTTIQSESSIKKAAMEFSNVNCSKDLPIPERNFNSCDSEVPKMQPLSYSVQSNKDSISVKSSIETELVSLQKLIAVEDESVDLVKNPPSARILMLVADLYRLNDGVQKEAIRVSESASMEVQSYQAEVLRETVKKKEDEISELKKQKEDVSIKISELKLKEEKLRKEKSEAETNLEKEKKQSQNAVKECADLRDYLHVVELIEHQTPVKLSRSQDQKYIILRNYNQTKAMAVVRKYAGWHIEDFSDTNLTLLLFCETLSLNIVFESPFLSTESSKILDMKLTAIKNPSSTIGTLAHHLIVNAFESLCTTKPCETSLGLPQFINTFTLLICDVTNLVSDLNLINIGHKLSVQNDRIVVQFHSVKAETIFNIHFIFTKIEQFPGFSVNTCHELELGNNWEKEILNGCKLHQLDRLRCFHDIVEHVDHYFLEKYYS